MSIINRIEDYLGNGGLFNPEMMEHDKVRNLIMDCRDKIKELEAEVIGYKESCFRACVNLAKAEDKLRQYADKKNWTFELLYTEHGHTRGHEQWVTNLGPQLAQDYFNK